MSYAPTAEQEAIVAAFTTGDDLVVEAGAGAGKTSTLKLCAEATSGRGVYLAYNKAIAAEASTEFPARVGCRTAHSLAYGAVGRQYAHRLKAPRQPARVTAEILGITQPLILGSDVAPLHPHQVARLVMDGVQRFCYSDAPEPTSRHVPRLEALTGPANKALGEALLPLLAKAWQDISRIDGRLRFTHDCYLKLWAAGNPQLPVDYVLLDEAQDSNPCVSGLVNAQRNAQKVLVGDACQAIYGWRGAVDAMGSFKGRRLTLSQSFRFGPAIADEANRWLGLLGIQLRLTGFDRIPSRIGLTGRPAAVLCRTNAEAIRQAAATPGRVAIVGGADDIASLARAAIDLRTRGTTSHPQLLGFGSWRDVQDHAEHDTGGSDLTVAVRLIDSLGPERVLGIIQGLVPEAQAELVLSTAHKAKGREWESVLVAEDFREPKPDESGKVTLDRAELMLAYVTVTRAKRELGRGGLAWIDHWQDPGATTAPPAVAGSDLPAGCERGPGDTLVSTSCLRCGKPGQECTCPALPLTWQPMSGLSREQFLSRVQQIGAAT